MDLIFTTDYNIEEVVELRKLSFGGRFPHRIDLSGLDWNRTDSNSIHFCYSSNNRIVGSLRLTQYLEKSKFESATQIPLNLQTVPPYVLLSRAATHPDYCKLQIHSKLRIRALQYCYFNNIESVFGSLEKKSKRLSYLLEAGYEIINTSSSWPNSFIKNDGDVVLIGLLGPEKIRNFIKRELKIINLPEYFDWEAIDPVCY